MNYYRSDSKYVILVIRPSIYLPIKFSCVLNTLVSLVLDAGSSILLNSSYITSYNLVLGLPTILS